MQKLPNVEARAFEVFESCAEQSPAERSRQLDCLRQSDPELHAQVLRLLEADAMPEALLHSPQKLLSDCAGTLSRESADPRLGSMLGAWRIDALIGAGGMGRVYLARRADGQYVQDVALKCISIETASPLLVEVIRNERDILAMLEHPNIATLLDGGIDAEGCPWFAMQRVQGEAINEYCDHRCLDLRSRVDLFVRLCEGLRYAHAKGALHSDLKPANVLVDDDGRPVLLDFGLSSLTARSQSRTRRQVAMTYGYTAPEVPTDGYSIASELYALGVMLRALLCGAGPESVGSISTEIPALSLPSQAARIAPAEAARVRGVSSPAALSRLLQGDLDTIVAACTDHDPTCRPGSVAQLQHDLRAWLAHRPISVRRQDAGYRLRLFLRRHRLAAMVACLVLAAAGIGTVAGLRLYGRSVQLAQEAQSMRRLFDRSFDALTTGGLGQSPLMSAAMLRETEADLRGGAASARVDPGTVQAMQLALARSYTTLGDYGRAAILLQEAQRRGNGNEGSLASLEAARAHLFNIQSRHAQARAAVAAGMPHVDALPEEERESARLMLDVELARAYWGMARIEEGRATLLQALVRAERMVGRDPRPLASLLILEGEWLHMFSRYEPAAVAFERAATLTRERAPLIADEADVELIQTLQQLGKIDRAVELASGVLERRRRLLGEQHPETGKAWVVSAQTRYWGADAAAAMALVKQGERILRTTLGANHPETVRATMLIGLIHAHLGEFSDAIPIGRRALAIMQQVYGDQHQETLSAIGHLGAMLAASVAGSPGSPVWQEVISLFERRVRTGMQQGLPMLSERMVLIKARMHAGKLDERALRELEDIVSALAVARGPNNDATHKARFTLIQAYMKLDKIDAAHAALLAVLRDLDSAPVTMATEIARINSHDRLGDIVWEQGRHEDARRHWEQALAFGRRMQKAPLVIGSIEGKLASRR